MFSTRVALLAANIVVEIVSKLLSCESASSACSTSSPFLYVLMHDVCDIAGPFALVRCRSAG